MFKLSPVEGRSSPAGPLATGEAPLKDVGIEEEDGLTCLAILERKLVHLGVGGLVGVGRLGLALGEEGGMRRRRGFAGERWDEGGGHGVERGCW
jgi:hypothetical protein